MSKISIEILNWEKYLHRKDMKSMTWFRVDSDIMFNPKLYKIDPKSGWFFICLLAFAAKKMKKEIFLDKNYLQDITGCDPDKCLIELEKRELVRICTDLYESVANITNITNITNKTGQTNTANSSLRTELVELWNATIENPKVLKLSKKREAQINARLKENSDLQYWAEVFKKITKSKFLSGSSGWKASFDWVMRPDNHIKILEGNYDDHKRVSKNGHLRGLFDESSDE